MSEPADLAAVSMVARRLEKDGYVVAIEPELTELPIDLEGYRPDIIAQKGREYVVVEVKTGGSAGSLEQYKKLAEAVAKHPNWRFLLATVSSDTTEEELSSSETEEVAALAQYLSRVNDLLESESKEFAVPFLWSALMLGMREHAKQRAVPVDAKSDIRVMNYLYSLGELSNEDYQISRHFYALRNELLHHVGKTIDPEEVDALSEFLRKKLADWQLPGFTSADGSSVYQ